MLIAENDLSMKSFSTELLKKFKISVKQIIGLMDFLLFPQQIKLSANT